MGLVLLTIGGFPGPSAMALVEGGGVPAKFERPTLGEVASLRWRNSAKNPAGLPAPGPVQA